MTRGPSRTETSSADSKDTKSDGGGNLGFGCFAGEHLDRGSILVPLHVKTHIPTQLSLQSRSTTICPSPVDVYQVIFVSFRSMNTRHFSHTTLLSKCFPTLTPVSLPPVFMQNRTHPILLYLWTFLVDMQCILDYSVFNICLGNSDARVPKFLLLSWISALQVGCKRMHV
ncbi:hypothetical protein SCLCIDRAFT_836864 [Scleroderma citrinum Foug A]|uniref:Uncharacterized protein n=1 Tax=Scleroderma citrinum Foug A TaxID=1036808 RepID=A0A0C3E2R9_9AGAM|nr:hypothetical protein SCLCIDRAFT_836864 [Scleroderma citrinum Foug A]